MRFLPRTPACSRSRSRATVAYLLALVALCTVGTSAPAAPIVTTPTGLNPGDTYQLLFVTSTSTAATNNTAAFYDAIVQTAATGAGLDTILGQSVTWHAIVSTAGSDARVHAPQTAPVYDLQDHLLATLGVVSFGNLYDSAYTLLAQPNFNEQGNAVNYYAWTGSNTNGTGLEVMGGGTSNTTVGQTNTTSRAWIDVFHAGQGTQLRLYALSSPIQVPQAAVPEPSSFALLGLGGVAVVAWRRWRGRAPA